MYAIYKIKKEDIKKSEDVLRDDIVSRQSITIRDASSISIDGDCRYILIEGKDEGIKRAEELFKDIGEKETEEKAIEIYNKLKTQEDEVAEGVGFVFG